MKSRIELKSGSARLALFFFFGSLFACAEADSQTSLRLEEVASGLANPLFLTAPSGDGRSFVLEQPGRIRILKDGVLLTSPFLDLSSKLSYGGERGLLGLAFHPGYAKNGLFFVYYTDTTGRIRIERYRTSSDPDRAEPASALLVLEIDHPYSNHNGGCLAFGPDGMLYIGTGDGGGGGDPLGSGQNRGSLLGKLLRIDVDLGSPYAVPSDNPLVGQDGLRPEIWAWGLRNPWRFAFDEETGLLYIADVGQNKWEEVNVVSTTEGGRNFGWNLMEGAQPYAGSAPSGLALTLPVLEYGRGDGCSITGGFVYRGAAIPSLVGRYVYADYCSGWIRSFRYEGGEALDRATTIGGGAGRILSFGEDSARELYVLSDNGRVYRIVSGG